MNSLNQWVTLVEAINEEDRLLRQYLALVPRSERDAEGPDGALSFKETLGHISFWDDFTVHFFQSKLDDTSCALPPPVQFEERSREALRKMRKLPFGEVLGRYLESTGALVEFLKGNWGDLTEQEKHDFWVPLKHRRHHRISLAQGLGIGVGEEEMVVGA